ncbi:CMGC protein kinase, variant [Fonticula alba]|uniref:CMGC protein kinase, variant n=1 Tax=Fonticula alba TaxID=691883 RepID=A0A058ZFD2_FONAL|nr:CMGC protein kinase, variant [Fonticula alba]KCV72187.1 CMGC protein kinase, variant [Fonticula alba]|eukprot:XP_009493764.1 CMGC protein kinase, variant [Fonticula alba]
MSAVTLSQRNDSHPEAAPGSEISVGNSSNGVITSPSRKYRILEEIYSQEKSLVLKVQCVETEQILALKNYRNPSPESKVLFSMLKEIFVLKHMKSDFLNSLHSSFMANQRIFIATPWMDHSLEGYLEQHGQMPLRQVLRVSWHLLQGLQHLHDNRFFHRDIKPANILVSDCLSRVKISDFDSTCFLSPDDDFSPSEYRGTRSYRAPEILLSKPYAEKVDIWSLACVIVEMLTGEVFLLKDHTGSVLKIADLFSHWAARVRAIYDFTNMRRPSGLPDDVHQLTTFNPDYATSMDGLLERLRNVYLRRLGTPLPTPPPWSERTMVDCKEFNTLIDIMFMYNPADRPSAREALAHPVFDVHLCRGPSPGATLTASSEDLTLLQMSPDTCRLCDIEMLMAASPAVASAAAVAAAAAISAASLGDRPDDDAGGRAEGGAGQAVEEMVNSLKNSSLSD